MPATDLNANSKTGHAIFKSRNSLTPIASISLDFTATGEKKQACKSGSEMVFTGHISGSVTLVASSKVKFTSAHVKLQFTVPGLQPRLRGEDVWRRKRLLRRLLERRLNDPGDR